MRYRILLPSFATLISFALLGISLLFLVNSQNVVSNIPERVVADAASFPRQNSPEVGQPTFQPLNLSLFLTRPLFSPTRRMPVIASNPVMTFSEPAQQSAPEASVTIPAEPPEILMIGVFEDGFRLRALIKTKDGNEQWVLPSDFIDGWRVITINPKSITLQLNGESVDIIKIE